MAAHDLIFFSNRNTPKVVSKGAKFTAPASYGKVTSRRAATAAEEKTIARGDWVRVDSKGNTPGKPGYSGGSNLRPALRKKAKKAKDKAALECPPCERSFVDQAALGAHLDSVHRF